MGKEIKIDPQGKLYQYLQRSGKIKIFRAGWKMPPEGFKTMADFEYWQHTKLLQMVKEWRQKENDDVRRSMPAEQKKFRDPFFKINWDIHKMLRDKKLAEYYFDYVMKCLCLTQPPADYTVEPPLPEVVVRRNDATGRKELWVQVFAHTTKREWARTWTWEIESKQADLLDYKIPVKEIHERLYNIRVEAKKQGMRVTNKQLQEFALRKYGLKIESVQDVSTILQRVKMRANKTK